MKKVLRDASLIDVLIIRAVLMLIQAQLVLKPLIKTKINLKTQILNNSKIE